MMTILRMSLAIWLATLAASSDAADPLDQKGTSQAGWPGFVQTNPEVSGKPGPKGPPAAELPLGTRIQSWIFRRYAGDVEMVEKADYPPGYAGSYYFRPWRRDWVRPFPAPLFGDPAMGHPHGGHYEPYGPPPTVVEFEPLPPAPPQPIGPMEPEPSLPEIPPEPAPPQPPPLAPLPPEETES